MTDYWLNKLMFDLQGPGAKQRWLTDRAGVIDEYPLAPELRRALLEDDFAVIQPVANAYLLRTFLLMCGLNDQQSMDVLHGLHDDSPVKGRQQGFVKGMQMPRAETQRDMTDG